MKTGSDEAAGGCLMFRVVWPTESGTVTLIGVVLGQRGDNLINAGLYAAKQLVDHLGRRPSGRRRRRRWPCKVGRPARAVQGSDGREHVDFDLVITNAFTVPVRLESPARTIIGSTVVDGPTVSVDGRPIRIASPLSGAGRLTQRRLLRGSDLGASDPVAAGGWVVPNT